MIERRKLDERDRIHLFGTFYTEPDKFQFSEFDKDLIAKLVHHVQTIMQSEQNANYFSRSDGTKLVSLEDWFFKTPKIQPISSENHSSNEALTLTHRILNKLLETADRNANTTHGGYRYDEELKSYASYLRMLAGPLAYETLQKNMPLALPSLSSTNRSVGRTHHKIIEGQLRCDELIIFEGKKSAAYRLTV